MVTYVPSRIICCHVIMKLQPRQAKFERTDESMDACANQQSPIKKRDDLEYELKSYIAAQICAQYAYMYNLKSILHHSYLRR